MKCFLHEALMSWGAAAQRCIIDNTKLARLRGCGSRAVIVPEMAAFAERYGFQFVCHALRHPNRKAGEERSFWTVETNFLPGRTFASLEDLNRQALEWATVRMRHRPQSKTGLIPAKAFEHERAYLTELSPHLPAPYRDEPRGTDEYGYVSVEGNYYGVPGSQREDVKILLYADRVKIYRQQTCLAEYSSTCCKPNTGSRARRPDCCAANGPTSPNCWRSEVGVADIEPAQVGLFFTLMQKRHKTKTTLITSNLGFGEWGSFLKNPQLTGALLDRLTETSYVFKLKNGRSLRPPLNQQPGADG